MSETKITINIFNGSCLDPEKRIKDESVDLGIFDPPFGIGETGFSTLYRRNSENVFPGYCEAPEDYEVWTHAWLSEAKRVLKSNGIMFVFMGHTNLRHLLNAAYNLGLHEINHLIWHYNFGPATKKKFVTSHYHILFYAKSKKAKITFNTFCRFGAQEKNENGGSLLYRDLEDVFCINRDYAPGQVKNQNKLPEALIDKLILYGSNFGDTVCDFFLGNFTTAYSALSLGRSVCGYEINKKSFSYHMKCVKKIKFGNKVIKLKTVKNILPVNQGKRIKKEEVEAIWKEYCQILSAGKTKKEAIEILQEIHGRGRFSIINIVGRFSLGKQ